MIKKTVFILLALLVILSLGLGVYYSLTTPWKEGVCKLRTVSSVPYLYEHDIVNFYWNSPRNPEINTESVSGVPEHVAGKKIFFSVPFPNRILNGCLFDNGDEHYTIYTDLNGNGSLSDESPYLPQKKTYDENLYLFLFGPLTLSDKNAAKEPFYLFITNFTGGIHVAPTTIQKGKIRINNAVYKLMLADLDFDGQFQTHFSPECLQGKGVGNPTLCDRFLIDQDNEGYFFSTPLPLLLSIDKQYYSIKIDGQQLFASPTTPPMGTLSVNTYLSTMNIASDVCSCFVDSEESIELPAGHYSILSTQNQVKDAEGDIWTCYSARDNKPINFSIIENQTTTVDFPSSFVLKKIVSSSSDGYGIDLQLFGNDGWEYLPFLKKNNDITPKPTIRIYDEQNNLLHTGSMEYG